MNCVASSSMGTLGRGASPAKGSSSWLVATGRCCAAGPSPEAPIGVARERTSAAPTSSRSYEGSGAFGS